MPAAAAVFIAALGIFLVNLPFGYWRGGLRKMSPAWFVAIHAPVPVVLCLRWAFHLPFSLSTLPLFVAAYFAGQAVGARVRQRRAAAAGPDGTRP